MRLNNKFDVLRGWPREGALDETFPIHQTVAGTDDALVPGMVCTVDATSGGLKATTTPNRTSADAVATWIIVEANDDFSSQFVKKAVGLRANAMFRLDPANLAAGTYTRGVKLSFNAGKWKPAAITEQIIGEVIKDDTAVDGTIVVYYDGGTAAKF